MPWCSPGTSGSVVNPGTLRRVTHVSPDRRNNHKVKASHMLNWRKTRKKTHNHSNTHMASWKLIAFWPATALSWGLHLILMISSSGSLSPLSTGYLQFLFSISHVSTSLSLSPDQETEPGLALLLALPHPALVQPDQVQQEHVPEGGGGDLTAGGDRGLLEDRGRRVARGQPQHGGEPRLCLHLQTVNLCNRF